MKKEVKKLMSLIMVFVMCVGLIPTHALATDENDVSVTGAEEEFAAEANNEHDSLTFVEKNYTGNVGETVSLTAVYVSPVEQAPTDFTWECSTENAVSFSETSVMGPAETGEENTYWISTVATAVKEGTHTIRLTVTADWAWTAIATTEITITEAVSSRYTVLILDSSGSMEGIPATTQREAAIKFCTSMLSATGNNYIAIVKLASTSSTVCNFSEDLGVLTNVISSIPEKGGTNMNQALMVAQELLDSIPDSDDIIKNIVLCSDGLPESGSTSTSGPYTSSDHSKYRYGNAVYNTAAAIKESKITIYTLGFFHSLSDSNLTFGRRLMTDIATSADCYYEVIDVENLEFVFDEIAGNITVEPVSINVEYSTFKPMTNGIIQYKIIAEVTNNSKTTDLTNVFVHLDEGDNAEIITEYGEWRQTADMLKVGEVFECMWVVSIDITNYSDGGEHPFLVYAGSDQTATSSIQGSIAVIATDGVNNSLDFGTDVWNFHNFSEEAQSTEIDENGNTIVIRREDHPLTEDDWNALLACSPSERAAMVDYLSEGGTNGHCFGMSLTTILNKMNIFDISDYSDASCLREAELTERVWSILCYYQGLHSLNSFTTDYQGFLLKSYSYEGDEYNPKPEEEARQGVAEQLTILAEKADTVRSGSSPVLFCFGCDGWGSHAVVADETESGSWNWDGKVYNKRIHLYDCNAANGKSESPIWNNEHCLYFNEGTDEWIIPAYKTYENEEGETLPCMVSTNWKNAYLMQACNDLTILNTHNYDASLYNYIAELRCQNETAMRLENENKQYVIMGKSGSVTGDTELATYYDAETTSNESNTGTLHVILPDEKEDYTISTLSGKAEELDFYIKDEDLFLSLDADAAEGSAFGLDGVITVSGNAGAYEVKIADDNIAEGEFDTYTFSGENTGDVSFELTNDGVLITGDDLTDITVSGSEGNTETDVTFSTDYEEVLVVPNDDNSKLSVFVDSDNDDIYDTDISTSSTSTDGSTTLAGEVDNGDLADTDNADIPATGDNTGTWLWLAIFLVSGIGVITAVQFSHSQKKRESK